MRQRREVGAHDLPLPALFDKDQGSSPVESLDLAVFGYSSKHVVRIDNPCGVVKYPARRLAKAKTHLDNTLGRPSQKRSELRFFLDAFLLIEEQTQFGNEANIRDRDGVADQELA